MEDYEMGQREQHNERLERLVNNLKWIGEDIKEVSWIIKDGIWLKSCSYNRQKFCDIIAIKYCREGLPIELKHDRTQKGKAIQQIKQGMRFIETELELVCPYGLFVTYGTGEFKYETIWNLKH